MWRQTGFHCNEPFELERNNVEHYEIHVSLRRLLSAPNEYVKSNASGDSCEYFSLSLSLCSCLQCSGIGFQCVHSMRPLQPRRNQNFLGKYHLNAPQKKYEWKVFAMLRIHIMQFARSMNKWNDLFSVRFLLDSVFVRSSHIETMYDAYYNWQ